MRGRVDDPLARREMAAALAAAGCRSFDIGQTLELAPRKVLEVELCFVLARQARHPEVELEIVA